MDASECAPGLVPRGGQGTGQGVQGVAVGGLGAVPSATGKASRPPSSSCWLSSARTVVLTRLPKPLVNALFLGGRDDVGCALLVSDGRRKGGLRLRAGRRGPGGVGTRTRGLLWAFKGESAAPRGDS